MRARLPGSGEMGSFGEHATCNLHIPQIPQNIQHSDIEDLEKRSERVPCSLFFLKRCVPFE